MRDAFERKRITFELSVHVYVFDFHLLIKLFLIEKKKKIYSRKLNVSNASYCFFASCPGKKAEEDCRQQLLVAKKNAESIAMITPALQKEFLEVFYIMS